MSSESEIRNFTVFRRSEPQSKAAAYAHSIARGRLVETEWPTSPSPWRPAYGTESRPCLRFPGRCLDRFRTCIFSMCPWDRSSRRWRRARPGSSVKRRPFSAFACCISNVRAYRTRSFAERSRAFADRSQSVCRAFDAEVYEGPKFRFE